jgi:hypothetical protein
MAKHLKLIQSTFKLVAQALQTEDGRGAGFSDLRANFV